jgi:hypothetical protein
VRRAGNAPKADDAAKAGTATAENGKAAKKAGNAEKPDKAKAKTAKSKAKDAKPKDDAKAEPATGRAARPATNANGVSRTAALTPGSDPGDVLSGLVR